MGQYSEETEPSITYKHEAKEETVIAIIKKN